jgi:HEAT repeat protein
MSHNFPNTNLRGFSFIGKDLTEVDFIGMRQWRYRSAVVATFVVALGNISLFLGVALAQGNLEKSVSDECSIANIKQYVAQVEKNYSSELEAKFKKCAAVAVPWLIEQTKVNNADTQVTAISLLAMIGTDASSAAPKLIELLQSSQNEDLRILAVGALPKVASSENLKSIITVLGSTLKDKNQDVRFGSALALIELYKNGDKLSISGDTANALRKVISKDVVSILIDAFKDDDTRLRNEK